MVKKTKEIRVSNTWFWESLLQMWTVFEQFWRQTTTRNSVLNKIYRYYCSIYLDSVILENIVDNLLELRYVLVLRMSVINLLTCIIGYLEKILNMYVSRYC